MIIKVYGVPSTLIIRWLLNREFKGGPKTWVDLTCGRGTFLKWIGVEPKKGIAVDVVEEERDFPKNFTFELSEVGEWYTKNQNRKFDLVSLFGFVEHVEKSQSTDYIEKATKNFRGRHHFNPDGFFQQDAESDPRTQRLRT